MTSEWKESANKRRDFRNSKTDPEIAKGRKNRGGHKKPWKLYCKAPRMFSLDTEEFILGRYKTEKGAKSALQAHEANYWGKYPMRIEKD